jgi:hypothetical protein
MSKTMFFFVASQNGNMVVIPIQRSYDEGMRFISNCGAQTEHWSRK